MLSTKEATIIHSCSSVLIRPNGIVRYINALIEFQQSQGHRVAFITDARPTELIIADEIWYINETSSFVPEMKDDHPWIQIDNDITSQISEAWMMIPNRVNFTDALIVHDLHSYLALSDKYDNGIFVQHESDIMSPESRFSYLSDEYLECQRHAVKTTQWRSGLTIEFANASASAIFNNPINTPCPLNFDPFITRKKTGGLLYIGDCSDRKGAKEFMQLARDLDVKPTVITHTSHPTLFQGADVRTYGLAERVALYDEMSRHKVAYIPSKNECLSLAMLECLQYMPTIVDSQYPWTSRIHGTGVQVVTPEEAKVLITGYLNAEPTDDMHDGRRELDEWRQRAKDCWIDAIK
jgi:hypothetical protein